EFNHGADPIARAVRGAGNIPEASARRIPVVVQIAANAREADHALWLGHIFLLQVQQVGSTGQKLGSAPLRFEQTRGVSSCRRLVVGEVLHVDFPPFAMASSTRCGVRGSTGTRMPRALKTALPTAAAVDIVGGSPMPITPRSGMSIMWT